MVCACGRGGAPRNCALRAAGTLALQLHEAGVLRTVRRLVKAVCMCCLKGSPHCKDMQR